MKPPFRAASLPLDRVSCCSYPGSPKLACKSNQPGDKCRFFALYSISVPLAIDSVQDLITLAISLIFPSTSNITNTISNVIVQDDLKVLANPNYRKYNYHLVYEISFSTIIAEGPANYII